MARYGRHMRHPPEVHDRASDIKERVWIALKDSEDFPYFHDSDANALVGSLAHYIANALSGVEYQTEFRKYVQDIHAHARTHGPDPWHKFIADTMDKFYWDVMSEFKFDRLIDSLHTLNLGMTDREAAYLLGMFVCDLQRAWSPRTTRF
jgi:hypothetical protein